MASKIIVAAILVLMVKIADGTSCSVQSDCQPCGICVRYNNNRLVCLNHSNCRCATGGCGFFDQRLYNGEIGISTYGKTCDCSAGSSSCSGTWDGSQPTGYAEYLFTNGTSC